MGKRTIRTQSVESIGQEVDPAPEVRSLRGKLREAEARIDELKRERGDIETISHDLRDAVDAIEPHKIVYHQPRKTKVDSPIAVVLHLTDWHYGKVQPADEIERLGEVNPGITWKGLVNMTRGVLDWVALHRRSYVVDECRLLVTGDLISGDIHDELRVSNAFPAPRQCVEAGKLLAELCARLAPFFPRVVIDMVTTDNHGRLTKKPQHRQGGENNYNYPLAHVAMGLLRDHKNVEFNLYPMEQHVVNVKGRQYLICHGHQVMGWMGFPYYGVQRKAGKEAMLRMQDGLESAMVESEVKAVIGKMFCRMVIGHWHAELQHPDYWVGAAACGTDAYDHSQGRHSLPGQSAWFVHPKHGEFDRTTWRMRV